MVDTSTESLLSLADATKILPRRPSVSTLWRWCKRGVRGIRLETCMVGGRRHTSREALERFISRTTAAYDGEPTPSRTPSQRERAIARAEKELSEAGI